MSDPKLELVWRKSDPAETYPDYVTEDGRWRIIHNKRSESKRWELYDLRESQWGGDWFSLNAAKQAAKQTVRAG